MKIKVSAKNGYIGYWAYLSFKEETGAKTSDYKNEENLIVEIVYELQRPLTIADFIIADNHGLKIQILTDTRKIKLTFIDKETGFQNFYLFRSHVKRETIVANVIDDEIESINCEMNNPLSIEDYALAEKLGLIINIE